MQSYHLEFITVGLGFFLLMFEAFTNGKKSQLGLYAAAGLAVILALLAFAVPAPGSSGQSIPAWLENFYQYDAQARFYKIIALLTTIAVLLMSVDYSKVLNRFSSEKKNDENTGEFYCLPIIACAGLMWMASAKSLVSMFVALELVTITFYVLVTYMRRNVGSLEAGVKYLILGALSTGFLVYGIAWIYGSTRTMDLSVMAEFLNSHSELISQPALLFGLALMLIALGFKVGAAPMQLWIPDVYQGAPTPITAFLSVASKAAGFCVLMRVFSPFMEVAGISDKLQIALLIIAGATLLYGNLAAISQSNFKRLLAYSSIAHAGFLILGFAYGDQNAVSFYLGTYLLMTLGAFFILSIVGQQAESDQLSAFDGLGKKNPVLAMSMTIIAAALAGVPLTAGFYGKFFVFMAALKNGANWPILVIAFASVAAGFYYYFKVLRNMYWNAPANDTAIVVPTITKVCLIVLTLAILIVGVYPQPLQCLIGG
ncbi:NADH-quinone oxidoreductase subunit N [Persicirhabdus sediminis]|uniref:NADH-quinone oxidoreductase subunit N n=1 Tax=Persicirhabdus sediminis TaxID=454144 RepID=A0A8J7SGA4_9BACT|nr:NADH-quinone oxidoreductase subunit N [Persicirhabdus sediminis]MBK1789990.1 NADH-quinone oxidoreductase subunit N [Persicirhabdus sediminis]